MLEHEINGKDVQVDKSASKRSHNKDQNNKGISFKQMLEKELTIVITQVNSRQVTYTVITQVNSRQVTYTVITQVKSRQVTYNSDNTR